MPDIGSKRELLPASGYGQPCTQHARLAEFDLARKSFRQRVKMKGLAQKIDTC